MSKADDAAIAAWIATRGVTRVAAGEHALPTDRRFWHAAVRGEVAPAIDPTQERRVVAIDAYDREVVVNGLGEWVYTE